MSSFRRLTAAAGTAIAIAAAATALGSTPADAMDIQAVTSPGGIAAWLVEDHTNPLIAVEFAFRGGAALDPDGKEGLAELTSALLDEGAGSLDSQAFQRQLEDKSIRIGFNAGKDSFSGSLRSLTENSGTAGYLLRLALTAPRFDDEPLERIRGQMLVRLDREEEDPDAIAGRTLNQIMFPGHPYGRRSDGTREGLQAISQADLQAFVARRFARDNLVIGVVGDVTPAQLGDLLDLAFGTLPANASPWEVPDIAAQAGGRTVVVHKDVPQSSILFAQGGPMRHDPDFYTAYVVNHVLGGGGFTSRLYEEAREKRGLAYGIGTGLVTLDHTGMLYGSAGTQNARVAETLKVVRDEWQRMASGDISQAELDDAKDYLIGSYPIRFTSSDRIANSLVGIQLDRLGIDYMDKRNALIGDVTLAEAKRVAGEMLKPDDLTVVVVGKPDGVEGTAIQ